MSKMEKLMDFNINMSYEPTPELGMIEKSDTSYSEGDMTKKLMKMYEEQELSQADQ